MGKKRGYSRWNDDEEKALRLGVEKYGEGKWKRILADSILCRNLVGRTNVDLKDKWRTMACGEGSKSRGANARRASVNRARKLKLFHGRHRAPLSCHPSSSLGGGLNVLKRRAHPLIAAKKKHGSLNALATKSSSGRSNPLPVFKLLGLAHKTLKLTARNVAAAVRRVQSGNREEFSGLRTPAKKAHILRPNLHDQGKPKPANREPGAVQLDAPVENSAERRRRNWRFEPLLEMWKAVSAQKAAAHFRRPVAVSEYEEYEDIILRPMDLSTIRRLLEHIPGYSEGAFWRDMLLMCQNALVYHDEGSEQHSAAVELRSFICQRVQVASTRLIAPPVANATKEGHQPLDVSQPPETPQCQEPHPSFDDQSSESSGDMGEVPGVQQTLGDTKVLLPIPAARRKRTLSRKPRVCFKSGELQVGSEDKSPAGAPLQPPVPGPQPGPSWVVSLPEPGAEVKPPPRSLNRSSRSPCAATATRRVGFGTLSVPSAVRVGSCSLGGPRSPSHSPIPVLRLSSKADSWLALPQPQSPPVALVRHPTTGVLADEAATGAQDGMSVPKVTPNGSLPSPEVMVLDSGVVATGPGRPGTSNGCAAGATDTGPDGQAATVSGSESLKGCFIKGGLKRAGEERVPVEQGTLSEGHASPGPGVSADECWSPRKERGRGRRGAPGVPQADVVKFRELVGEDADRGPLASNGGEEGNGGPSHFGRDDAAESPSREEASTVTALWPGRPSFSGEVVSAMETATEPRELGLDSGAKRRKGAEECSCRGSPTEEGVVDGRGPGQAMDVEAAGSGEVGQEQACQAGKSEWWQASRGKVGHPTGVVRETGALRKRSVRRRKRRRTGGEDSSCSEEVAAAMLLSICGSKRAAREAAGQGVEIVDGPAGCAAAAMPVSLGPNEGLEGWARKAGLQWEDGVTSPRSGMGRITMLQGMRSGDTWQKASQMMAASLTPLSESSMNRQQLQQQQERGHQPPVQLVMPEPWPQQSQQPLPPSHLQQHKQLPGLQQHQHWHPQQEPQQQLLQTQPQREQQQQKRPRSWDRGVVPVCQQPGSCPHQAADRTLSGARASSRAAPMASVEHPMQESLSCIHEPGAGPSGDSQPLGLKQRWQRWCRLQDDSPAGRASGMGQADCLQRCEVLPGGVQDPLPANSACIFTSEAFASQPRLLRYRAATPCSKGPVHYAQFHELPSFV